MALGLRSLSISELELRTSKPTDNPLSSFTSSGMALETGWGKKRGPIQFGGTIRLVRLESDGGITYSFNADKIITGFAIRNIGIMKKFNRLEPKMPTTLSLGVVVNSFSAIKSVDLLSAVSMDHSTLYGNVFRLGGELSWEDIIIWAGTNSSRELISFSGGVGFRSRILTVSYGFQMASNNLSVPHILQIHFNLP